MREHDISQAELSRAAGVSRPTINRLYNENAEIKPEWAVRIGYTLDLDPKLLMSREAEEKVESAKENVEVGSINRLVR
jgi:plasmid maintenance system antidote protein VapI